MDQLTRERRLPLLLFAVYLASAYLSMQVAVTGQQFSLLWLPAGVAAAGMYVLQRRAFAPVVVGALVVNVILSGATGAALLGAIVAVGGAIVLSTLMRLLPVNRDVTGIKLRAEWFGFCALIGTAFTAFFGTLALSVTGAVSAEGMVDRFAYWWMGDLLGVMIAGPLTIRAMEENRSFFKLKRQSSLMTLWLLCAVGLLASLGGEALIFSGVSFALLIPFFVWAVVLARLGTTSALIFILCAAVWLMLFIRLGVPIFGAKAPLVASSIAWAYLLVASGVSLAVSGIMDRLSHLAKEQRLIAERTRLNAKHSPAMIWEWNADTRASWYNDAWNRFAGFDLDGSLEVALEALAHPMDLPQFRVVIDEALRSGEPFIAECRLRRIDGYYRNICISGSPINGESNKLTGYTGTAIDNTDSSSLAAAMLDAGNLLDSLPFNIWIRSPSGEFLYRNKVQNEFWGKMLPLDAIKAGLVRPMYDPALAGNSDSALQSQLDLASSSDAKVLAGAQTSYQLYFERDGKSIVHEVRKNPIRRAFGAGIAIVGTARDITDELALKAALSKTTHELSTTLALTRTEIWRWNSANSKLYRVKPSRSKGVHTSSIAWKIDRLLLMLHPEDRTLAASFFIQPRPSGDKTIHELELRIGKGQNWRWVLVRASLDPQLESQTGSWMAATVVDIDNQKRTQIRLEESEQRFQALTRLSADWYWETDENHQFVDIQSAKDGGAGWYATDNEGPGWYSIIYLLGKTRWELDADGDPTSAQWNDHRATLDAQAEFRDVEIVRRSIGKRNKWIAISGVPVFDKMGCFRGYRGTGRSITLRKEAQLAQLADSTRRRILFENAKDPIFVIDFEFRVVAANLRFAELMCTTIDALIGRGAWEWDELYLNAAECPPHWISLALLPAFFETAWRLPDDTRMNVEVSLSVVHIDEQDLAFCICRDITDRIATARSLSSALSTLESTVQVLKAGEEMARLGHWEVYPDSTPILLSDVARQLHRLPVGAALTTSDLLVNYEFGSIAKLRAQFARGFSVGDAVLLDAQIRGEGGKYHWVRLKGWPVRAGDGAVIAIKGIIQDVDADIQLRETLQLMTEELRSFGKHAPGAVYSFESDRNGGVRFPFVSESAKKLWGIYPAEIMADANTVFARIDLQDLPVLRSAIAASEASLSNFYSLHRYMHPVLGERWIRAASSPTRISEQSTRWHGYAEDFTEKIAEDEANILLLEKLEKAKRLESIGTLAAGIAHDFNNVIGVILGHVELAIQTKPASAEVDSHIKSIKAAAKHAREAVQHILSYSQQQPQSFKLCRVRDILAEAVMLLRVNTPSTINIIFQCSDEIPSIFADANQIERVLVNLGLNAIYAIGDKPGSIQIGVALLTKYVREEEGSQFVCIEFKDNGKGMSAETIGRIIDPFYTTKPAGIGTGLGMSVADGIVRAHGGTIRIESELGIGSTFFIELPVQQQSSIAQCNEPLRTLNGHTGKKVMYVDDQLWLLTLAKEMLENQGFGVDTFADPLDALSAFRASPNFYDAVVSDYDMPIMGGMAFCRKIRELSPSMPVALITGHVSKSLQDEAKVAGIFDIVYKPNIVEELSAVVKRMVGRA